MPVPFRDATDIEELGAAAYLIIKAYPKGYMGALLGVNARGDPLEFTYGRVEALHSLPWHRDRADVRHSRQLIYSLLPSCRKVPTLLLYRGDDVDGELFTQDGPIATTVCRIVPELASVTGSRQETKDEIEANKPMCVSWFPHRPDDDSATLRLFSYLVARGLLLEPFERAVLGLLDVYKRHVLPQSTVPRSEPPAFALGSTGIDSNTSTAQRPRDSSSTHSQIIGEPRTVYLADTLLKEDVISPNTSSAMVEDQIWEVLELKGPESQIPLERRLAYLLQPAKECLLSSKGPLGWPKTFFPYQVEGIELLTSRDALLLADDMGLGKTVQAIAALRILIRQRYVEDALVVVPASLVTQWRKEIRAWAPELRISTVQGPASERAYQWSTPAHLYLTSYETLREDFTPNPHSPPRRRIWDVVILDEAQKIKNRDTEVSRKCKLIPRRRAWVLTGTPLENTPDDLASILEFTRPLERDEKPPKLIPGTEMSAIHKKLQLRRKKADVLPQLPPKTVSTIALPLLGDQRETYDRAEKQGILQLKEKGQSVRIENVLELILRLKQLCNFCPTTSESAKLDDVQARLATLVSEGHRALVFSQFTDDRFGVQAVANKLRQFRPLLFTGAISLQERNSVVEQFKSNPVHKVLVLSLRAGGQGLNLQEASYVFHFDRWWNPAVEHQAEDRTHRLGQTSPVHVYQYTCENTIEERIEQILQQKQKLFDELVDDVSIDLKSRLTEEELFGLFGLTPPRRPGGKGNPSTGSG